MMLLQLQKRAMAIAGLVMTAYLIFHMVTNLTFFSPTRFSDFYQWYNSALIRWTLLLAIVISLALHVRVAVVIRKRNAEARGVAYAKHDKLKVPAPLVTLSIILLLLFIVLHIVQTLNFNETVVYDEVLRLFQSPIMLLIYLGGLFILAMHLQHSLTNVLQTLGITSKTCHGLVISAVVLLAAGFAAVPVMAFWSSV